MTNQQAWPIESIGPKNYDGNRPVKLMNGVLFHADDDELAAAGITPPEPPIDFDALPDGTIVKDNNSVWFRAKFAGRWHALFSPVLALTEGEWTVVHVDAAPDKRTALHTLGLTDNDIAYIANKWMFAENMPTGKIVAAAREVTP